MKKFENEIDTKDNSSITILPLEVEDILSFEVRIAEYYTRNIRDIRVRNDYLSIAKLIDTISEGYNITICDFKQVQPIKQVLLIEYWYGNNPDFKQELKDKNIFPTFIIEHEERGFIGDEHTAILGYCFNEPIKNKIFVVDIYNALLKMIFNSELSEFESNCYNAYDYGAITNLTISNNVYSIQREEI